MQVLLILLVYRDNKTFLEEWNESQELGLRILTGEGTKQKLFIQFYPIISNRKFCDCAMSFSEAAGFGSCAHFMT